MPASLFRWCAIFLLMAGWCLGQEKSPPADLPTAPSAVMLSLATLPPSTQDNQQPPNSAGDQRPSVMDQDKNLPWRMRDLPIVWLIGPYIPNQGKLVPLTLRERTDVYVGQTYLNVGSYLARGFAAGIDQARGTPYQWGGGFGGYGRRFASRYSQFVIQNSLVAAGNAGLGYEPRYDFCRCQGFWPRTRHAIARNFYTYNETEKEKRVQVPLYVGSYAAGAIASTWMPGHQNPWKNGGYAALQQAGYGSAINWVSEFALDILRIAGVRRK